MDETTKPNLRTDRADIAQLVRGRTRGVISADRKFVSALARGLLVLETFADESVWLHTTEVAARARLPKPTTSRLLQSLAALGHVYFSPHRRQYRLATGVLALGYAARDTFSVGELVRPHLRAIADEYNVHASLAGRDRLDVIELDVCHSNKTLMTLQLEVGSRIPIAGTATGHALLAALPDREREYLMKHLRQRHFRHWDEISSRIEDGIRQYRDRGYTTSLASWQTDINGVAVPLVCPGGAPVLVLACGAPARHLPRKKTEEVGRRLIAVVKAVQRELAGRGAIIA